MKIEMTVIGNPGTLSKRNAILLISTGQKIVYLSIIILKLKELFMNLSERVHPVDALNLILEKYDYLEYDESNSESIVKLRVKVKETCLEIERDSAVMHRIKKELELATDRFYVPILNPVSGSPSQEIREKNGHISLCMRSHAPERQTKSHEIGLKNWSLKERTKHRQF